MIDLKPVSPRTVANTNLERCGNVRGIFLRNFSIAVDSTKSSETGKMFLRALEKYSGLPVKFLVLTHYHTDHRQEIPSFKDVPIICNVETLTNIPQSFRSKMEVTLAFENKLIVKDRDLTVEIYHAGGHTSDSSFALFPRDRIVFAGDLIFENTLPFAMDRTCSPDKWITALEQLESLDVKTIVPGHGPILDKDDLDKHIALFKLLRSEIREAIHEKRDLETIEIPDLDSLAEQDMVTRKKAVVENRKKSLITHVYDYYKKSAKKSDTG